MAGRKKLSPAAPSTGIQIVEKTPPAEAAKEIAARDSGAFASRQQIMRWLKSTLHMGEVRAATVAAKVSDRIIAESYVKAVESEGYIGLPYDKPDGTAATCRTLDEFCSVFLGKSARRCRELALNLETLGAELYDAAQAIGLGQRDHNALKALPADDQEVVKAAIAEGGDKDAVVGMLTALVERQAAEKAALTKDLEKTEQARSKAVQSSKDAVARMHELELTLPQRAPDETLATLLRELHGRAAELKESTKAFLEGAHAVHRHAEEHELDANEDIGAQALTAIRPLAELLYNLELVGIKAPVDFVRQTIGSGRA